MNNNFAELRLKRWIGIIRAANNSGMSKKDWCEKNGIGRDSFYYRQKKIRNLAASDNLPDTSDDNTDIAATAPVVASNLYEIPLSGTLISNESEESKYTTTDKQSSGISLHFNGFTLDISNDSSMCTLTNVIKVLKDV